MPASSGVAPADCMEDMTAANMSEKPTMTTTVMPSVHQVERRVRNLIHSERSTWPNERR